VTLEPPFDDSRFELFNVLEDPGETRNLANSQPEKYVELLALWAQERRRLGIVLPEDL
jgi:arylsulfatase